MAELAVPYPLRFNPVLQRYLWGGRKLGQRYHKPVGTEGICAESWEVADVADSQSVVANGPWAGKTLAQLVAEHETDLFGPQASIRQASRRAQPGLAALARFPLLIKLLDAAEPLSVQVHPDAVRGALLNPPELGKTEAWYVLEADPGARIYAGLLPGVDRAALERAVADGTVASCLASFEPQPGDCILLPAGTVHALGAGVLVFEVQTPCDITYRLFDWNRLGADGRPRPLHVREGLAAIDFALPAPTPVRPAVAAANSGCQRLAQCEAFVIDRLTLNAAATLALSSGCHVLHVVEGRLRVGEGPAEVTLGVGDTVLLPAALGTARLTPAPQAVALDVSVPVRD